MGILDKPLEGFNFLKGDDLKAGVTVKLKSAEAITLPAEKAEYAVSPKSKLVAEGILKEGQTMRYTFDKYDDFSEAWGTEAVLENTSTSFYTALSKINPEPDTVFTIKRIGDGTATTYNMAVVSEENAK